MSTTRRQARSPAPTSSRDDGAWTFADPALDRAEVRAILVDPLGHGGRVLKENPRRTVTSVDSPLGRLVVKHYREGRVADRLKASLAGGLAAREWRAARALEAAGLPVPPAVAHAVGLAAGFDLFAAREVVDACPLGGLLEEVRSRGEGRVVRRRWLDQAIDLLVALHRAGFDHRDFHGGNLLVDPIAERLMVIDLHRVARGRVRRSRRATALADLMHTLRYGIDGSDVAYAVARYADALGGGDAANWRREVARRVEAREKRRVRSRSRRAVRESSGFTRVASGGVAGFRRRDTELAGLFTAVASARAALERGAPEARSIAPRSSVAVAAADGRRLAVKVYERDGWRRRRLLRGRAGAAYLAGHGLAIRDVAAPAVVAWLRTPDRAFLLMDEEVGAEPLTVWSFRVESDPRQGARIASAVAGLLGDLFRAGVDVHDLSPKNILITPDGDGFRAALCDFDGIRFRSRLSRERMIRGLSQANDISPAVPVRVRLRALIELRRSIPALRGVGVAASVATATARRAAKRLRDPAPGSVGATASEER